MSGLLTAERALYEDIWTSVESYANHAPGQQYVEMFYECAVRGLQNGNPDRTTFAPSDCTVLDAGTGSGKGALALKALTFRVYTCDVTNAGMVPEAQSLPYTDACLWHDLSPIARGVGHPGRTKFDFVYCCDVLEHIPTQFTMLAIDQMLRVARYGLFLSVSLVPDSFGVWAGKSLHQTVQSFVWWRDSLKELGTVEDARDLINDAVFFVRPK